MRLEMSLPRELEDAKARRVPLVIPVGTIEYHGPHCAPGCDTQIAAGLLDRLAARRELVVAPPIWYGVASYAVAGPDKNTVDVNADVFESYVYCILKSLIEGGWRSIYLVIHHQYEQENMMPMTLSCMKAAKKLLMEYLERTQGRGWWGSNRYASYYEELGQSDDPFSWITVLPAMSAAAQSATGYDHAGKWECSILSAIDPEAVKKERIADSDEWFIQSAADSSPELGQEMIRVSLDDLDKRIR
ncbi:MAG: creatininase family protein [Clostridiales bacterium]|nr:creatininase family protein [Clostridiales bacterium]